MFRWIMPGGRGAALPRETHPRYPTGRHDVVRCCTLRSGGGFPVELIPAARLGLFRRPGGVCRPFAFGEQKGATMSTSRPDRWRCAILKPTSATRTIPEVAR
jgi:hypothetical protein